MDDLALSSEIQIEHYDKIRSDRNRHGGGIACFIRNDLILKHKSFFPSDIENIFKETFLPHSKLLVVAIIYRPPNQGSFTETITEHFSKINTRDTETYILGDFNINLFSKQKHIFHQTNTQSMSHEAKNLFPILFFAWLGTTNKVSNSSNM